MKKLPSKQCIVCGRPVPRIGQTIYARGREFEGLTLKKAECARYTNLPYVLSVARNHDGTINSFHAWDGESYQRGGFFCTNRCAEKQGLASAHHGARFTWRRADV